ncbi:HNH endonuclease [Pseudomonas sp. GM80]|uniref:HNH endonuclease n=1 Tax=Pseudomonas sp. GM80 TaxID=1144339 RepID=UPI00026FC822|nr:HNH endonuclease [Pseudomonas sp. GM80]EJN34316.1 putative restriction endonuclease [Pseudomonas sp. GM80]
MDAHESLKALRPKVSQRVYDVLVAAGLDVDPWHWKSNGQPEPDFARNQLYRSRWVFVDAAGEVLMSLWYDKMKVEGDEIIIRGNAREDQMMYRRMGEDHRKYQGEAKKQEMSKMRRGVQWASKAGLLDNAIRNCESARLDFSVAIVDRAQPHDDESENANARELDTVKWHVRSYTYEGDYVLVRGPRKTVDGVDVTVPQQVCEALDANIPIVPYEKALKSTSDLGTYEIGIEDQFVEEAPTAFFETSRVYPRDQAHRRAVLKRSAGFCEFCGAEGFLKSNGNLYLETHHIVPLSEEGLDNPRNMIALCPNDHRQAHYAARSEYLREAFLEYVTKMY